MTARVGVTVIGEAIIDLLPAGPPQTFQAVPGGSPYNVAIGLARLGHHATLMARLGDTAFGRILREGGETHGFWEIVQASPALRDYAEASFARQADDVGTELAREWRRLPDDPICHALARALCGANMAILVCGLERLTAGEDSARVVADMLTQADAAYDLLEHGMGQYAAT